MQQPATLDETLNRIERLLAAAHDLARLPAPPATMLAGMIEDAYLLTVEARERAKMVMPMQFVMGPPIPAIVDSAEVEKDWWRAARAKIVERQDRNEAYGYHGHQQ